MRKYERIDWKFFAGLIGVALLIGVLTVLYLLVTSPEGHIVEVGIFMFVLCSAILSICFFAGLIGAIFAKKTKKKLDEEVTFSKDCSFDGDSTFLYIDLHQGKIAIISYLNPLNVQIFDAREISEMHSQVNKLGNAVSEVSFRFKINGKKVKIPTLTCHRTSVSIKSNRFKEAWEKSERFVGFLRQAQMVAEKQ